MKMLLINNLFYLHHGYKGEIPRFEDAEFPVKVEIESVKDYHMFGDTSLEKNTNVVFKLPNDHRKFECQYGWSFIEDNEESLQLWHKMNSLKETCDKIESEISSLSKKMKNLSNRVNNESSNS